MLEFQETEQDATTRAVHYNPLLCQECQIWNDSSRLIRYHHGGIYEPNTGPNIEARIHNQTNVLEISELSRNAVFAAAQARMASSREPNAPCTGTDRIDIEVVGPILLEDSHSVGRSLDNSQLGQSMLRIAVKVLLNTPYGRENLIMIPRFCLRYTKSSPVRLLSMESWEHPFFDVGLLRQWVHICEDVHEEQAIAPTKGTSKSPTHVNLIRSFIVVYQSFHIIGLVKTLFTS